MRRQPAISGRLTGDSVGHSNVRFSQLMAVPSTILFVASSAKADARLFTLLCPIAAPPAGNRSELRHSQKGGCASSLRFLPVADCKRITRPVHDVLDSGHVESSSPPSGRTRAPGQQMILK